MTGKKLINIRQGCDNPAGNQSEIRKCLKINFMKMVVILFSSLVAVLPLAIS